MQIEIFIPSSRDANSFLDEIISYSQCKFVFSSFKNFESKYNFVNIHWPESLFGWQEPTTDDIIELKAEIKKWKKHAKLIYTYHDERHHFGIKPIYFELFNLIEANADIFIHLGEHSKKILAKKFPNAIHKVIFHPLYINSFVVQDKLKARKELGIDADALVIMAAGRIRNLEERELTLKAFKFLSNKNKVLISNNMLPFKIQPDFRGRIKLKKIFNVNEFRFRRMTKKLRPPTYLFNFGFTDPQQFSNMASASDIILIPRINTLNSGNVFLGMTFNKVIVGPAIGNIKEVLEMAGLPVFNPGSKKSLKKAMGEAADRLENNFTFPADLLQKYHPKAIAEEMDKFLKKNI